MGAFEVVKAFIKSTYLSEKAALNLYEWLPLSLRYRFFLGSTFFSWLSFLEESEHWSREKYVAYQFEQMKDLCMHALKNVPYYKKLFLDIGFYPQKVQSLDDFACLPYLTRETVRDKPGEFVDERILSKDLIKKQTSGSSGIPMTIYRNREAEAAFHAFRANLMGRIGHNLKAREVMLWSFIEIGKNKNLPFIKYGNKLILSARYISEEWFMRFYDMMRRFDPDYVSGYTSSLALLSSFIMRYNLPSCTHVKAVINYAETLYDWQRELIERAFGARAFSMYSMTESAALGGECECSGNLHIYPQHCFVELQDAAGNYKEIIGTGFTNYAMPFIRYQTGDLVRGFTESCTLCGRHHTTFKTIEGRVQDFLVGKNGEIIPRLMPWIKIFPNTTQCQFFQDEPGKAYIKIMRGERFSDSDAFCIRSRLREMLGPMNDMIDIEMIFVDHMPSAPSGKLKLVEQKLDMKVFLNR